ncbi:MAG: G5 domain-containing protein [Armatimonadetes bacterium]|nr:G5 domain-containing protein [Armatimonadota bacterium]
MEKNMAIRCLKVPLLVKRCIVAIMLLGLTVTWAVGHFRNAKSLIIVDGKPVACVPCEQDAEDVLSQIKSKTGCNPSEIQFREEVRVARAPYNARPVSRHMAYNTVRGVVSPLVPRWAIIVNGKPLVAVPNRKVAGEALDMAKLKFGKMVRNLAEEPQIKENVAVDIAAVEPGIFRATAEEAVSLLFTPKRAVRTDAVYEVRKGDVAVVIASRHGISLDDLMKLNPGVNLDRLHIGDKLNVKAVKQAGPGLTVVVRDQSEREERIPAPVHRVSSAKLPIGQEFELAPGRSGLRKVKVATIYENGRQVGSEVISEDILREPSPRRIAMGIKARSAGKP